MSIVFKFGILFVGCTVAAGRGEMMRGRNARTYGERLGTTWRIIIIITRFLSVVMCVNRRRRRNVLFM